MRGLDPAIHLFERFLRRWMDARVEPAHDRSFLLLQMPGKEREAARPGDIGAGLVVTRPFVAVEAVLRAGIDMDLDLGPLGADGVDIAEWNAGVLFAELKQGRHVRIVVGN